MNGLRNEIVLTRTESDVQNETQPEKRSDKRTRELIKASQSGDASAKEILVKENMGLIWSIIKRFSGRGYEIEDLSQIGSIGLIKCIDKFDLSYDVKFSTYAVPMILGEIRRFIRDDGIIKISRPLKEMAVKAKYMQESIMHKTGRQPTVHEIAAALETEVEDLVMALEAGRDVESLHATIYQSDGNPVYLIDKLDKDSGSNDKMIDAIAIKQLIDGLAAKERQVIIMRYFHDKTQDEIAKVIGVSQVQVSRIEKKALLQMRKKLQD